MSEWGQGFGRGRAAGEGIGNALFQGMELRERMKERAETKDLAAQEREATFLTPEKAGSIAKAFVASPKTPDEAAAAIKDLAGAYKDNKIPAAHLQNVLGNWQKTKAEELKSEDKYVTLTPEEAEKPEFKSSGFLAGHKMPISVYNKKIGAAAGTMGQIGDKAVKARADMILKGLATVSETAGGMGVNSYKSKVQQYLATNYPNFSERASESNKRELTAEAQTKGTKGYIVATAANAVDKNLKDLAPIIESLPSVKLQMVTAAIRKGQRQINDKQANKALTLLLATALESGRVETGGYAPDEQVTKRLLEQYGAGLDSEGFAGVQQAADIANRNRVASYKTSPWELGGTGGSAGTRGEALPAAAGKVGGKAAHEHTNEELLKALGQ